MILTNILKADDFKTDYDATCSLFRGHVQCKDGTYKPVTIDLILSKSAPLLQLLPTFDKLDFKIDRILIENSNSDVTVSIFRFKSDSFEFHISGEYEVDIVGLADDVIRISEGDIPEEASRLVDEEKLNMIFNNRRLGLRLKSSVALYGFLIELLEEGDRVVYLGLSTISPAFRDKGTLECFEFRRWDEIWEEYCWLNGEES